jgi:hypothetical protein
VQWRLGFLEALAIESEAPAGAIVRVLCRAPVARWLRDLRIGKWDRDDDPRVLAGLAHLRRLRINTATGFTDDDLHTLARLPRLAEVSLGECELSAHGIANLPATRIESLRFLNIRGFSDAHVAATARQPIRALEIHGAAISDASLGTTGEALRSIALVFCPDITSRVFAELAARPLTGLDLAAHEPFDGAELARLARGTLEELAIHPVANLEAAVRAATTHAGLRTARLVGAFGDAAPVDATSLARLCALPALRELAVRCQGEITGARTGAPMEGAPMGAGGSGSSTVSGGGGDVQCEAAAPPPIFPNTPDTSPTPID